MVNARIASVLLLFMVSTGTHAQVPDTFTNLEILPQDIERQALLDVMDKFRSGLGVTCHHCHAGEEKIDYASDEKETKQIARRMMGMTQKINATLKPEIGRTPTLEVTCATCHHGVSTPRNIHQTLVAVNVKGGMEAVVEHYRELRKDYFGRGAYDFGERTLLDLSAELSKTSETDDALFHLLHLNLDHFPESIVSMYRLGKVYRDRDDVESALKYFRRILEIQPDYHFARNQIERLTNKQEKQPE